MFENELLKPPLLEKIEALIPRIKENHEFLPIIEEKLKILRAGYNGEKTLHYFLSLLPEKKYHIFHDLRLPVGKSYFQIDALLLSPFLIHINEAKNFSGKLLFEKNQLIQEVNGTKKIYQNPLSQTNRHKILLHYFFERFQIPYIPIEHHVVVTNSSTEIKIAPRYSEAEKRVCKADHLLIRLAEAERYYQKEIFDQKTIGKVKRLLLNKHTPEEINILEKFQIGQSNIIQGVQCPNCSFLPMTYYRKVWVCPSCFCISKDAYIQAIKDYFLLIKPSITNSELKAFLQLPSSRCAAYILSLLNFTYSGTTKGRIYYPKKKFF